MAKDFKKQVAEQRENQGRVAVPQVDPERPLEAESPTVKQTPVEPQNLATPPEKAEPDVPTPHLTVVDTSERAVNKSFSMYPSRHEQIVRDLAYIERRHPWQIIEDMAEEYVVKHYGKEHKRK